MSITIKETGLSTTSGDNAGRNQRYAIMGAASMTAAEDAMASGTGVTDPPGWTGYPATIGVVKFDSMDIELIDGSANVYEADLTYRKITKKTPPDTNDEEISFDISSQTTKLFQSKETRDTYSADPGAEVPDFKGGVGYDGEKFQGVDILTPAFSFSITKYFPAASVTNAFVSSIRDAAFKTNTGVFRGCYPGEVLFVGASGSKRNDDDYAITYKFLVSPNVANLDVGDMSSIQKRGWDYLWALYEDEKDANAKKITPRPTAAYVERVYDSIDFPSALSVSL